LLKNRRRTPFYPFPTTVRNWGIQSISPL
jgi:hypothetical protein